MNYRLLLLFTGLLSLIASSSARAAISSMSFSDFNDGTTQNWFQPAAGNFSQEQTGGPLGMGDGFLRVTATGGAGPGGRIAILNNDEFVGNFSTEPIVAIRMDLRNLGTTNLNIRVAISENGPGTQAGIFTNDAISLPAMGDWVQNVEFSVRPSEMTADGVFNIEQSLQNSVIFKIYDDAIGGYIGTLRGTPSVLGIDNVRAIAVPEPSTLSFLAAGGMIFVGRRRRRS